ncbi:hypothetical protein OIU81_03245 [Streptomyces sp. NBC_01454]|nr:hypothetical protein [Streptomyces sp. NBC_01454]
MNETGLPLTATTDPDFAASIAAGLTESFADYCTRTAKPDEEAT